MSLPSVTQALAEVFPSDPPRFMARTPHGYYDEKQIRDELKSAGFTKIELRRWNMRSKAASARELPSHTARAPRSGTKSNPVIFAS